MTDELELVRNGGAVELISDGDGLAILGERSAVERYLQSQNLASSAHSLPRASMALSVGSGTAQAASELSANFGRWVKLTEKSAQEISKNPLMKGSSSDVSRAVVVNAKGQTKHIVEFVKMSPKQILTNPAMLAGVGGIMAQMAMQQAMDEITDYLKVIDAKVDDILRAQKDAALAEMIGVDFAIQEAITIRQEVGRVSEITWSKIQSTPLIVGQTQAYALRQLDALAEKMERTSKVADLAKLTTDAETIASEWLAVLARCFQLQDAIGILELDRVLDAAPDELERHRIALRSSRMKRRDQIARTTEHLLGRIDSAAQRANSKVLLHPVGARSVVASSNQIATGVLEFQQCLGLEPQRDALEATRWRDAAADTRDKMIGVGAEGVDSAVKMGIGAATWAKGTSGKLSADISTRFRRPAEIDDAADDHWLLEEIASDRD